MSGEKIKTYKELIEAIEEKYPLTLINHKKWGDGSQRFIFFFKTPLGEEEELKRLEEYFGGVGIDITMTYDRFSPLPYHVVISVLNKEQEVGKTLIKFYSEGGVQKVYDKIINALNNIFSPSAGLKRKREQRTKEPWEMTREEFGEKYVGHIGDYDIKVLKALGAKDEDFKFHPEGGGYIKISSLERIFEKLNKAVKERYTTPPPDIKEALHLWGDETFDGLKKLRDYVDALRPTYIGLPTEKGYGFHKKAVEEALKEGKPVPPEVLRDYPDLAEKYGKAVEEREKTTREMKEKEPWKMTKREWEATFGFPKISERRAREIESYVRAGLTWKVPLKDYLGYYFKDAGKPIKFADLGKIGKSKYQTLKP